MQTIIFVDIDSTLVENRFSRRVIAYFVDAIVEKTGKDPEEIGKEIGLENWQRQKDDPNNVVTMDWDDILETICRRYDVEPPRKLIDLWEEYATQGDVEELDNAAEVMQQLKAPHRKLVIATKGLSKYQYPVLDAVNLRHHFDDILTPDITNYLKTQPEYFTKYTENAHDVMFIQVGDHYYDDVVCAKRNGFYSIMRAPIAELKDLDPFERPTKLLDYTDQISTYYEQVGHTTLPDVVVLSLEEVPEIVKTIEKQHDNAV